MTADAAFWNDLAERYARQPVANPGAFERKIEITRARMKPTDVVLDIGCGTGSLALRLAPSAATIHGLDCGKASPLGHPPEVRWISPHVSSPATSQRVLFRRIGAGPLGMRFA